MKLGCWRILIGSKLLKAIRFAQATIAKHPHVNTESIYTLASRRHYIQKCIMGISNWLHSSEQHLMRLQHSNPTDLGLQCTNLGTLKLVMAMASVAIPHPVWLFDLRACAKALTVRILTHHFLHEDLTVSVTIPRSYME